MTAAVRVKWFGPSFDRRLRRGLGDNLDRAGRALRDAVRADISVQGSYAPPVHAPPGHPPYRQTGDLIASYFNHTVRSALAAQVGTTLAYGRYQEEGTSRMLPRPHLRSGLLTRARPLAAILCTPI